MTKIHIHLHHRTHDAEFKESDHPRATNGQFGSGGSGGSKPVRKVERTPMTQANRNLQAQNLKESKKVTKQATPAGHLKSGVQEAAEAEVAQARKRIAERKKKENEAHANLKSHPNYSKEDHEYLKGEGWTAGEIKQRWDSEQFYKKKANRR